MVLILFVVKCKEICNNFGKLTAGRGRWNLEGIHKNKRNSVLMYQSCLYRRHSLLIYHRFYSCTFGIQNTTVEEEAFLLLYSVGQLGEEWPHKLQNFFSSIGGISEHDSSKKGQPSMNWWENCWEESCLPIVRFITMCA